MANAGDKYAKSAKSPLERFKHQNTLMKQFGEEGLRVYTNIDGVRTAAELIKASGIGKEKFDQIIDFMAGQNIITVTAGPAGGGERIAEPAAPSAQAARPGKRMIQPVEEAGELPPPPEVPENVPRTSTAKRKGIKAIAAEPEEEEKPAAEEETAPQEEESPASEEAEEPAPEEPAAEEAPEEEEKPAARVRKKVVASEEMPSEEEEEAEKATPTPGMDIQTLSPLEKTIFNKFGKVGVDVYALIDGERTAEEILSELGISEVKLVEILEFMDKEGIIRLEKPEGEGGAGGAEGAAGEEETPSQATEPALRPMVEEGEGIMQDDEEKGAGAKEKKKAAKAAGAAAEKEGAKTEAPKKEPEEELAEEIIPIDIPSRISGGIVGDTTTKVKLMMKHKGYGPKIFEAINGKRDIIDLVLATGFSFYYIDLVMADLVPMKMIKIQTLTREDVRAKYGNDGFPIYKRYGRDGVLIYELIGKVSSLPEIVAASQLDPYRVVEIFMFIHKVLGLEMPLDKNVLYKQLGLSPPAPQAAPGGEPPPEGQ